jgi:hypothetical protein
VHLRRFKHPAGARSLLVRALGRYAPEKERVDCLSKLRRHGFGDYFSIEIDETGATLAGYSRTGAGAPGLDRASSSSLMSR